MRLRLAVKCFALIFLAAIAPRGRAQNSQAIAIRAGHLIDGKSDAPIANALIVVEADKIVRAERLDQALVVWQHPKQLGSGEGRVQKEADRLCSIQFAQLFAEGDQMVVVDPNEILRQQHRSQSSRKHSIDAQITG